MIDFRTCVQSPHRDIAGCTAVLALGLAAFILSGNETAAEGGGRPQLPHLVAEHGAESACPKAAANLPESRGRVFYVDSLGLGIEGETKDDAISYDRAVIKAKPGDTIQLAPGQYGDLVWPKDLDGTPDDPITLRAEHPAVRMSGEAPDLIATPVDELLFSEVWSLKLDNAAYIRIDGIYGYIEAHEVSHIELLNNYHHGNDGNNILLTNSTDVSVHDSIIENFELRPGYAESWFTDYGVANYYQERVAYYRNYFNGGFNHAISLKTNNSDITISCNRFNNCGRHCIELGQQTDGKVPGSDAIDRTSQRVLIKRNLFEVTDRNFVNADYAVMIMNVDDVILEENRFTGIFEHSILLSSYWEPTYCSSTGEFMSQIGIQPNFARIADNHFDGKTNIRITGRGVPGDTVEISKVTGGPVSCEVLKLAPITCEESCCTWDPSPQTEQPPEISLLDNSIDCS